MAASEEHDTPVWVGCFFDAEGRMSIHVPLWLSFRLCLSISSDCDCRMYFRGFVC
jgi:hypothetical protein